MSEPAPRFSYLQSIVLNVVLLLGVAASAVLFYRTFDIPAKAVQKAEITGPDKIEFAGQLALFRATVPGKSPKDLIHTWGVEPLGEHCDHEPVIVGTVNAGETQLTTVAGRWRLWCAITDPATRTGQMLSRLVVVPGGPISPKPSPEPLPSPPPAPTPSPPAPAPAPAPTNRFSDLTTEVRNWLLDVNSPNKATEAAALRSGALAIVDRLKSGDLSTQTGTALELNVVRAVQASNSDAIKANASAWKGFAGKVGTYAGSALAVHKLSSAADWAEMLSAFAAGLS